MGYDFIFNFKQLFTQISRGSVEFYAVFNSVVIGVVLAAVFTIFAITIMLINGLASNDIKLCKAKKRINKFFAAYGVLSKENLLAFNKYCISQMPKRAKKAFRNFAVSPKSQTQAAFKLAMQKGAMSSGVAGFVTYIVAFVLGVMLSVAVSVAETFVLGGENLWLAISLFYGALLLIATAVQMYFISNRNANTADEIYVQVVSRSTLLMQKEKQAEQVKAQKEGNKEQQSEQACAQSSQEKPIDSIDELRMVVNGLIEKGASKELLAFLKSSLQSVAKTGFASHVDNLRMNNIIKKLEEYSA